jgi:hypothetical protein
MQPPQRLEHDHASCLRSAFLLNVFSAATHGALCRLEALLDADPLRASRGNEYAHTPLQLAALHGHTACVALLLARGADVAGADVGYSALHRAAAAGRAESLALLLAAPGGAAPALLELRDRGTGDGRTALAKAAAGGHADCVSLLLRAGADACARDARGRTPRALAEAGAHTGVAALLPPDEAGAGVPGAPPLAPSQPPPPPPPMDPPPLIEEA